MARKQTSPEVSQSAARLMGMTNDEIFDKVVAPSGGAIRPERSVGFEQFCRDVRAVAASALSQDERKGA